MMSAVRSLVRSRVRLACAAGALWCGLSVTPGALAAVFYTETFDSDMAGWVDRDPGEMNSTWNGGFGDPAGSVEGTFNAQVFPVPQTDAWQADATSSSGSFTGNYWNDVPGFAGWQFSFYAEDVLPSALTVRFGDGTNVFSMSVDAQVHTVGLWYTVNVPLQYNLGWLGGSSATFSNALSSVNYIDIEVTRSGKNAQSYYLDNFTLVSELIFVPEPTSGLFWFGWALVFGGLRRKLAGRRERSPYALTPAATR